LKTPSPLGEGRGEVFREGFGVRRFGIEVSTSSYPSPEG